jgi:hypothetical protein
VPGDQPAPHATAALAQLIHHELPASGL